MLDRAAALGDRAEIQTLRARALQMLVRPAETLRAAELATALEPSHAEAWLALGLMELNFRPPRTDRAIAALRKAVAWSPRELRAWLNLGRAHTLSHNYASALTAFQEAEKLSGPDKKLRDAVRMEQAEALVELERMPEALAILEALFRTGVRLPGMPRAMGRAFVAQGDFPQGLEALEAALKIDPEDVAVWDALAVARQEMGKVKEADAARQKASALRNQRWRPGP